ncbi:MAG: hypothetical protein IJ315_03920 [Firmicutes bacterium]|nr:hypothetical protein [Bacillota bacterium]
MDGGCGLRKPAHSFGWDIFPRTVSAGLWKSVKLVAKIPYSLEEVGYMTSFDGEMNPKLEFYFSVSAPAEKIIAGTLRVKVRGTCGEDSSFNAEYTLRPRAARGVMLGNLQGIR